VLKARARDREEGLQEGIYMQNLIGISKCNWASLLKLKTAHFGRQNNLK